MSYAGSIEGSNFRLREFADRGDDFFNEKSPWRATARLVDSRTSLRRARRRRAMEIFSIEESFSPIRKLTKS